MPIHQMKKFQNSLMIQLLNQNCSSEAEEAAGVMVVAQEVIQEDQAHEGQVQEVIQGHLAVEASLLVDQAEEVSQVNQQVDLAYLADQAQKVSQANHQVNPADQVNL